MYRIITFRTTDKELAKAAFAIRQTVFVDEQKVSSEEEYDEFEDIATHYLLMEDEKAAATARWRQTPKGIKLERFAVLPAYRNKGAGTALIRKALEDVLPLKRDVYLHAQVPAMNVYLRAGFEPEGELFYEAGIPHYRMLYKV